MFKAESPDRAVLQKLMDGISNPELLKQSASFPLDRNPDDSSQQSADFLKSLGLAANEDLEFFRDMMEPIESRSRYWQGRADRILKMVLILNKQIGKPVDERQLTAAVYVHDFGMAFIPPELLHKEGVLSDHEISLLRSHVQSSAHLLQHMPKWQQAKEMVLQHHEAVNGSGYPYGLREREICEGAKIIAVADSFDAITHQRAYGAHLKTSVLKAIKDINDCGGRQLSLYWVEVFNQVVEPVITAFNDS
jgi:HD-GYP domain-containing protein (c-di-GMP phosphodiesterase class II)